VRAAPLGLLSLAFTLAAAGCGPKPRPAGPAPEYERPVVTPWDAGKPVDPLEEAEARGEAVDDEVPVAAPVDAGQLADARVQD
jgi:hypothetical protein